MDIIAALDLEHAPSDTARAFILEALASYAGVCGRLDLQAAAKAALPAAHPHKPPPHWREAYLDSFSVHADEECNVDPSDGSRYSLEYWRSLTDAERQARLANPQLGRADGQKDAENLNDA